MRKFHRNHPKPESTDCQDHGTKYKIWNILNINIPTELFDKVDKN